MPSKPSLTVCLDANIIFSAIGFGGIPEIIMERLFRREFQNVTSKHILEEAHRNILKKLDFDQETVDLFINLTEQASFLWRPGGHLKVVSHSPDNLVLEVAVMSGCDVLVTGDKKHLLPLNPYKGVTIEKPADFLKRLDSLK